MIGPLLRGWCLAGVLSLLASPAVGQLGEGQLGMVATYGTGPAFGAGAGLVLGVATGRLAYVGVRWTYHFGETRSAGPAVPPTEIRNRVQSFAVDLHIQIPAGGIEIAPGVSFGALRFSQRTVEPVAGGGTTARARVATEFLAAPSVSVEIYAGRLSFIPQLQYAFAGNPDLPSTIQHRSLVGSVRIVVTKELGRIRH